MKALRILSVCLIAALLSAICCVAVVSAETIFTNGDYSYTLLDGSNISIYSWDGTGALELPEKLDVYTIKEIRNNCFNSREDLTTVDLHAASYLKRIGIGAFRDSSVSGELNIPPQVKTVATSAFQNCDSLDTLYYNAMSDVVSSQCFYDCDALREVYLADSLTGIESHAFADCDALSLVRIGENVTAISDTAFSDDENIVIYCYTDSYAHQFAVDNGYDFVLIDAQPEISVLLGDADDDSFVTIRDVTTIQRLLSYIYEDPDGMIALRGDIAGDGLDINDATLISRYLIDIELDYPINQMISRPVPTVE